MGNPKPAPFRRSSDEMELALDSLPVPAATPAAPAARCTDGELLTRIAERDGEAFGELYARYSRAVLGLALRRLRDRGRAEDAVQDTFASVWRAAASYRAERGPGAPWLYAVARNAISDRARARHEPTAEAPDDPSPGPGPDEQAEQAWVAFRVHRAVHALAEHERELIELAYWGGLSQSEIAERLQIPLGTVKTRTRAALARLADVLEELR